MKNSLNRFQEAFINFIVETPKKALGVFLFLSFAFSFGLANLKTDFTYKVWYNDNDPLMKLYQEFERNFGNDDSVIIGVYSEKGIFNKQILQLISDLTNQLYQVQDVIRVDSVLNFDDIKANGDEIDIEALIPEKSIDTLSEKELESARARALDNSILKNSLIGKSAQ
jgi:predicted RND superfamily exporter protein